MEWIVQQLAVKHDMDRRRDIGGSKGANGRRHEQPCTVRQNVHSGCRVIEDIRQRQRQQLVGADGIVRRRFLRADLMAVRMEAVA